MSASVAYCCSFVPPEWIAAHGLQPSRILCEAPAGGEAAGARPGLCPYARAAVGSLCGCGADAVVMTTNCDQMRRAYEWVKAAAGVPAFLLNLPSTWQTVAAQRLYLSELERLGRFLETLGGTTPSRERLAETMIAWDAARRSLRAARGRLGARAFAEAVAEFHRTGRFEDPPALVLRSDSSSPCVAGFAEQGALLRRVASERRPSALRRVAVALVGGPMRREDFALYDMIEEYGGELALDGTETGERALPAALDLRRVGDEPLVELALAYFGAIPDAFRRPNSALYEWLGREVAARGVRGILLRRYLWCDLWHAETGRMREWAPVPVLELDAEDDAGALRRIRKRVQAFLEVLS